MFGVDPGWGGQLPLVARLFLTFRRVVRRPLTMAHFVGDAGIQLYIYLDCSTHANTSERYGCVPLTLVCCRGFENPL